MPTSEFTTAICHLPTGDCLLLPHASRLTPPAFFLPPANCRLPPPAFVLLTGDC